MSLGTGTSSGSISGSSGTEGSGVGVGVGSGVGVGVGVGSGVGVGVGVGVDAGGQPLINATALIIKTNAPITETNLFCFISTFLLAMSFSLQLFYFSVESLLRLVPHPPAFRQVNLTFA